MSEPLHSLYTTEIEEEKIEVEEGLFKIIPKHTKYSLYIGDFGSEGSELNDIYNDLRTDTPKTLEIFIDSNGGLISEGQKLQNIIENNFANATDTYLDNKGFSMGAYLFLMGTRRIVHRHSEIMFHNFTASTFGKGHEIASAHKHQQEAMRTYTYSLLSDYFSKKEIKKLLEGKDYWMTTEEMLERGIATHIMIGGALIEASDYLNKGNK